MRLTLRLRRFQIFALGVILLSASTSSSESTADLRRRRLDFGIAMRYRAFCNDYTIPNYYLSEKETTSNTWVFFLEGGGLCTDKETCFKRFNSPDNVLMTAEPGMRCDSPEPSENRSFPERVYGYDILSNDVKDNPSFARAHRVVIPYCSSDLWLGRSDVDPVLAGKVRNGSCVGRAELAGRFVFRGVAIFRAVIADLRSRNIGLCNASTVLVAGSSAGGVGAINSAAWLQTFLRNSLTGCGQVRAQVAVLADSQWFIDFHGVLQHQVSPWALHEMRLTAATDANDNGGIASAVPNYCTQLEKNSYPCCISTRCLLETCDLSQEGFANVSVFTVFSLSDLYLPGFYELPRFANISSRTRAVAEVIRLMTEYSGAVNYSLTSVRVGRRKLNYFTASCLQHVFLATSSLWDKTEVLGKLMGNIYRQASGRFFKHTIAPGRWNTLTIETDCTANSAITKRLCACSNVSQVNQHGLISLRCAITVWFDLVVSGKAQDNVRLLDTCHGISCNAACPESIQLGELTADWSTGAIAATVCCTFIYLLSLTCLVYKGYMIVRMATLVKEQQEFLTTSTGPKSSKRQIEALQKHEAIGIACLGITYEAVLSKAAMKKIHLNKKEEECRQEETNILNEPDSMPNSEHISPSDTLLAEENSPAPQRHISSSSLQAREYFQNHPHHSSDSKRSHGLSITPDMEIAPWRACLHLKRRSALENKMTYTKVILHDVNTYFNPGNLIAVMGPSGSGKTTLLDLLTGRRRSDRGGQMSGKVYINGCKYQPLPDWYIRNTGYVMQLAVPYFEELTVRQNLTLAANLRLPDSLTNQQKFERVEQVIAETGMATLADIVVGSSTGLGLSGGQKRRLCVALQLLDLPKVLFLDEPTSGLDATSSMELLQLLNMTAASGRLVIVTIHQPRLEIFHMFDIILLLCQGTVAYYGTPTTAPQVFIAAIQESCADNLRQFAEQNPADVLIDLLSVERYRNMIMSYYKKSEEPVAVKNAVKNAGDERSLSRMTLPDNIKRTEPRAGWWTRLFVHESRASIRNTTTTRAYLPVIYLLYAFAVGSAYYKATDILLLMSAFCIWSFAPSIFMFPAVHSHLSKALEIFHLEKEDGIGKTWEIIVQCLMRFGAITTIPIIGCTAILYMMIMHISNWHFTDYLQLTAISLALNMVWTSFAVFLLSINPGMGFKAAPLITSVTGFVGGFLIPKPEMKDWYSWMFYVNPNYYGYSAMMFIFLDDIEMKCYQETALECYHNTGHYYLERFGFDNTQPYLSVLIMLFMMVFFIILSLLVMEIRFNNLITKIMTRLPFTKEHDQQFGMMDFNLESTMSSQHELSSLVDSTGSPSHTPSRVILLSTASSEETASLPSRQISTEMGGMAIDEQGPLPEKPDPAQRRLQRRQTNSRLIDGLQHTVYTPPSSSESIGILTRRDRYLEARRKVESRRSEMELNLKQRTSSLHLFDGTPGSSSPGVVSPSQLSHQLGSLPEMGEQPSPSSRRVQFATQQTASEVIPGTLPRFIPRERRPILKRQHCVEGSVQKSKSAEMIQMYSSEESPTLSYRETGHSKHRWINSSRSQTFDESSSGSRQKVMSPLLHSLPLVPESKETEKIADRNVSQQSVENEDHDGSSESIPRMSESESSDNCLPRMPSSESGKQKTPTSLDFHSAERSSSSDDSDGGSSLSSFETYAKQNIFRQVSIRSNDAGTNQGKKDSLERVRVSIVDKPRHSHIGNLPRMLSFQDSRKGSRSWWPEDIESSKDLEESAGTPRLAGNSPLPKRRGMGAGGSSGTNMPRSQDSPAQTHFIPSSSHTESLSPTVSANNSDHSKPPSYSPAKSRRSTDSPLRRLLPRKRQEEYAVRTWTASTERLDLHESRPPPTFPLTPVSPPATDNEKCYLMSSV